MHYMNANQMHRAKARWELHKNVTSSIKQIQEGTNHETTVVRPLANHLYNNPNKMNMRNAGGEAKAKS